MRMWSHSHVILSAIKTPQLYSGGPVYSESLVVGSCVFGVFADTASRNGRKMFLYWWWKKNNTGRPEQEPTSYCGLQNDIITTTTKQQKREGGALGLWLHIKPSPWCIHAFLAPSPRGVVCKWVPGSTLSVWQHSACEGPTDARNQAARPSLVLHQWGFAI